MRGYAPRILGVKPQALEVLRKAAIGGGSVLAGRARSGRRAAGKIHRELLRVTEIVRRVHGEDSEILRRPRERATHYGFVDKVHPEAWRVTAGNMTDIVPELIFLL